MASDLALLTRWADRREAQAFKEIVSRYAPMVYATCVRVLGDPDAAEDVAQECFETLVKSPQEPQKHLGAWLHRVATNRALDRMRSEQRRRVRETRYAERNSISVELQWDDLYDHVDASIAELPEDLRIPVVGYYLQGQTHSDIARSLGISRRTVARRVAQGTETLGRILRRRGIAMSIGALTALMSANLASAAPVPASLAATLGKLALAQAGTAAASGVAAETGLLTVVANSAWVTVGLVVVAVVGVIGVTAFNNAAEPAPASIQASRAAKGIPASNPSGQEPLNAPVRVFGSEEPDAVAARETPESVPAASSAVAVLTGKVVDSRGGGIRNAQVVTRRASDGTSAMTATDGEGRFLFTHLPAGTSLSLSVSAEGYESHDLVVEMPPGGTPRDLVVALESASSIAGQVVDADYRPLPRVRLALVRNPDKDGDWYYREGTERSMETDFMGRFAFGDVPAGTYTFMASSAGFTTNALNAPVRLTTGSSIDGLVVVVPISAKLGIQGYVSDESGYAVPDVRVTAESIYGFHRSGDGSPVKASAATDANGFYRLDGVADPVDLLFEPPEGSNCASAWLNNVAPGTLSADAVLKTAASISGVVVDAGNAKPVENFSVRVWRVDGNEGELGPKEASGSVARGTNPGTFSVSGLSPGTVQLYAEAPGHAGKIVRGLQVRSGEAMSGVEIALGGPCVLEGRILMNGREAEGRRVGLELHSEDYPTLTNRLLCAGANPDGTFRYDGLPEGTYLARPVGGVYSSSEWHRSSRQYTVTLVAGETTYAEFDIGGTCTVRGHVQAPEGSARCVVCLYDPSQVPERPRDCLIYGLAEYRIVGAHGDYELSHLAPGTYLATAYSSDAGHDFRRAQTHPIVLEDGGVLDVNFDLTYDVAPGVPDVSLDDVNSP